MTNVLSLNKITKEQMELINHIEEILGIEFPKNINGRREATKWISGHMDAYRRKRYNNGLERSRDIGREYRRAIQELSDWGLGKKAVCKKLGISEATYSKHFKELKYENACLGLIFDVQEVAEYR